MITEHDYFLGPPRISEAQFAAALRRSPVLDERPAAEYHRGIRRYGVDPLFLLGMFTAESSLGREGVARHTKSWGNVKANSNQFGPARIGIYTNPEDGEQFSAYATWLDGAEATAARLSSPEWVYASRDSIREIFIMPGNPVWAPVEDRNNPANYLDVVLRVMNEWGSDSMAAKPPVVEAYTKINHEKGRDGNKIEAVVLHIAEGYWQSTIDWFRNPDAKVSSHFVIRKDGVIAECVRIQDTAWTNGWDYRTNVGNTYRPDFDVPVIKSWFDRKLNPNSVTATIEHEGFNWEDLTDAQMDASTRLTRWILAEAGIQPSRDVVLGHYQLNQRGKPFCPGLTNQEWDRYMKALTTGVINPAEPRVFYIEGNPYGRIPVENPIYSRWIQLGILALPMVGYPVLPPQDAGGRMIQKFERGWLAAQGENPPWDVIVMFPSEIAPGPS